MQSLQHQYRVTVYNRSTLKGHTPLLIWFTGLSGSGKSTIADQLEQLLFSKSIHTCHLDGDQLRYGLNAGLGFSDEDRHENLRRVGEVAKLMLDAGLVVMAAFISPFEKDRRMIRELVSPFNVLEVFVNTPLEECERRDVKGLYAKARKGQLPQFTGISSPYEAPLLPDLEIKTMFSSPEQAANAILAYIDQRCLLQR